MVDPVTGEKIPFALDEEEFFLSFENIKFDDTSDDEVLSFKLHRVKRFKKVKMIIEYKNHTILETENVDEANNVYRKLKERYTYLDSELVKTLRDQFNEI
jgi:hypothetical protein